MQQLKFQRRQVRDPLRHQPPSRGNCGDLLVFRNDRSGYFGLLFANPDHAKVVIRRHHQAGIVLRCGASKALRLVGLNGNGPGAAILLEGRHLGTPEGPGGRRRSGRAASAGQWPVRSGSRQSHASVCRE
ncbi:hypothetical protein E2C05_27180 [Paracraurococcus ruber]|uniref:hypothetical protein n=1 Tax=Paracraurococcus ruber TaxID=77675 RepID=UPI001961FDB4|nr:hypothetical protein [Paracraurococcus ruber]TDG20858.1 hypothetical protein E2C05_27180 [Paracraurococcus ruber]